MKLLAKQNRELIMINAQNTQNENDTEKITLQVPEQYQDFNKKIVFVTPDGNVWDIITNNEYLIKKAITKYEQVDFYIWLTKGDEDFRTQTKTLKFYHNVDASNEITDEEIGRVNTVINLLEEEIENVQDLELEVDGKLEEVETAIDNINLAIQETENLNLDAEKVGQTTTVILTKKDGTTKVVHIDDGVDLQFMWQGTSLGIKTAEQQEYTFVDLQGVQGQRGEQGEPFTIKKTYSSVAEMNADFNNMQLGDYVMIASTVEVEDNAKLYTRGENQWIFITDFSGATGIRGETGLTPNIQIGTVVQGSSFNVTRTGTNENPVLNFTLVKGDKGDTGQTGATGATGATGNGISSIKKTGTSGLVDTYTITYTNGNTTTFTVTNGEDGEVTETELNELRQQVTELEQENEDLKNNQLTNTPTPAISHYLQDSADSRFRKFIPIGRTTQESTTGKNLFNEAQLLEITGWQKQNDIYFGDMNNWFLKYRNGFIGLSFDESTQYTISFKGYTTGGTPRIKIVYADSTTSTLNFSATSMTEYSFTTPSGKTISSIQADYGSGSGNTIYLSKFQVEKGSTATPYEPYTGGNPAPNPNYPYAIKNCGDNVNIFDLKGFLTERGVTYTENDDGSLTFDTNAVLINQPFQFSDENTIVSLSGEVVASTVTNFRFELVNLNNETVTNMNGTTTKKVENINACKIRMSWGSGGTITMKNIKLEQGTQATPYSPYGCGNVNEKVQNKNLFDINDVEQNLWLGASNTRLVLQNAITTNYIKVNSNKSYVFSSINSSTITAFYTVNQFDKNYTWIKGQEFSLSVGNNLNATVNLESNCSFIKFSVRNITLNTNVQIEQGSKTSYVPHSEQNISFPLAQGQRLMEGDYLADDGVHHKRGEVVFDGSNDEDWQLIGSNQCFKIVVNNIGGNTEQTVISNVLCNCLKAYKQSDLYAGTVNNGIATLGGTTSSIYIRLNESITSATLLKASLEENPITVEYELEIEVIEAYTEEQQAAYNQIKSARTYKPVTHIFSEDETPANVEIEYVQDTKTYIDNKVTALTNAITSLGGNV